jgi:hypothetical protein
MRSVALLTLDYKVRTDRHSDPVFNWESAKRSFGAHGANRSRHGGNGDVPLLSVDRGTIDLHATDGRLDMQR